MTEVVYACNEVYLKQTLISVISLWRYHPYLRVHLIVDGIGKEKIDVLSSYIKDHASNLNIIPIERVLREVKLSEQDRHPRTIYAKLFLDKVLTCDKVLYIDSDIVVAGSFDELLNRDMSNELAAGVIMPYSNEVKRKLGLSANDYHICDGMVLLNLERWREQNISEKCRKYIEDCKGNPYMMSEGVLNYICRGKIGVLEPAYNLMPSMIFFTRDQLVRMQQPTWYYSTEQIKNAKSAPKMIHFMRELYNRPWFEPCDHPYADYYRKLDKQIFGGKCAYKKVNVSFRTRVNKCLYKVLPFGWYVGIYRMLRKINKSYK